MTSVQSGNIDRRSNERLGNRVITLELEGQFYSTLDWSLGGFMIEGYEGTLEPGKLSPVNIILENGSDTIERTVTANVVSIVRSDLELKQLAAQFNDLSDEAFRLLAKWQSGHPLRGAEKISA